MPHSRPNAGLLAVVLVVVLLPAAYMGSYYAMFRTTNPFGGDPMYRVESPAVSAFFWPAHQVRLSWDRLRREVSP